MSKKFDLQKYKANMKESEVALKKDTLIPISEALQLVTGLQGIPLGHVCQCYGSSNGGKSSLAYYLAAQAQTKGIVPVFVTTEGKISPERIQAMGVDPEQAIFKTATYIEDVFTAIKTTMQDQAKGDLPVDLFFIIDSIGNTISRQSVKINKEGEQEIGGAMMKVAKIIREEMRLLSHSINDTRKVTSPKNAGLLFINHSYKQPPAFPGGPTLDVPYGGDGIFYASSLVIKVKKTKLLKATKNGIDITFGLVSKLAIEKNHISGISNTGEFVITPDSILANDPEVIKEYKATHKDSWGAFSTDDGELLDE